MVKKIRLYRGEGEKLDNSKLPPWILSAQGMWYSDDIKVAKRFASYREKNTLHYIEVPEKVAESWKEKEGIERGEYLVPKEALKNFKKNYIKSNKNLENKFLTFFSLGTFILSLFFISFTFTGNIIFNNLKSSESSFIGIILLGLSLVAGLMRLKNNSKLFNRE